MIQKEKEDKNKLINQYLKKKFLSLSLFSLLNDFITIFLFHPFPNR